MKLSNETRAALALGLAVLAAPVAAQEPDTHTHEDGLGTVRFPVSCESTVQEDFDRAVAILHSFGYEEARREFQSIVERDPACGIGHWGIAMSYWHPLWAAPTPAEFTAGRSAAGEAARIGARTERERAYISAINRFYGDADRLDHAARAAAYQEAMRELSATYPQDDEARIFHALAILGSAPAADPMYAAQKEAAKILTELLPEHPRHPGIAHYTIHAFDQPELADLALPAARVYAHIAPTSPHALHMPTHIFTRLGLWQESIDSNHACEGAAKALMARIRPGVTAFEAAHCRDYLVYAYLQLGEDERALDVLDELQAARRFDEPNFAVGYALLAAPARYALERRDWRAASALGISELELPWEQFSYALAVTHFANAIGAARAGDGDGARRAVARLKELHAAIASDPPPGPYDWAGQIESTVLAAEGWLAASEGRFEVAVQSLTAAAEKEEAVGKHPVTPGAVLPARELLGDLLLELGRNDEALVAYEASLSDSPRRFNSILGAARAARAAGESARSAEYYRSLVELAGASGSRRAEIGEAEEFLAIR